MPPIIIQIYNARYEKAVQQHILQIQTEEYGVDIDLERQPDLRNIPGFYQHGLGNFWIATYNDELVGTIALLDIGNRQTALRKMFVKPSFRGKEHRAGQLLLDTLISFAKNEGAKEIYLGTTAKFIAAQRFYEKNEFTEVEKQSLPERFPVMAVDIKFYKRQLQCGQ